MRTFPEICTTLLSSFSSKFSDCTVSGFHLSNDSVHRLGMVPQAVELKRATDKILSLYEGPPKESIRMGQACVCWICGFVGIPKDYDESRRNPGPCANCNTTDQINWVTIKRPDGSVLPWMEASAMSAEQEKKMKQKEEQELAERRAAVEARVAAALKERERPPEGKR